MIDYHNLCKEVVAECPFFISPEEEDRLDDLRVALDQEEEKG
jgi:hypothetical protein